MSRKKTAVACRQVPAAGKIAGSDVAALQNDGRTLFYDHGGMRDPYTGETLQGELIDKWDPAAAKGNSDYIEQFYPG